MKISFKEHRAKLIDILKKNHLNNSVVLFRSPDEPKEPFSEDDLAFYQEAMFFWLTGWHAAGSAVVIDVLKEKTILLIPEYTEDYERWSGPIPSKDEILELTGVDEVCPMQQLDDVMDEIKKVSKPQHRFLGYPEKRKTPWDDIPTFKIACGLARKIKSPDEIEILRKAAQITSDALIYAMRQCKPGIKEKVLEAAFLYKGVLMGADCVSFPTIVASGKNASYIHYQNNTSEIPDNGLVLIDCGLFYNHYTGDVTRTFPANGKFSEIQKLVYTKLLNLQMELIDMVKPGVTIYDLDDKMLSGLFSILKNTGVVKKSVDFSFEIVEIFCPHGVSHHIGCNCHDPVMYDCDSKIILDPKEEDVLGPGMVVSIEPGLYFNEASLLRNSKLLNCINYERAMEFHREISGMRIEDDILVTESGNIVLSNCPKLVEDIEKIVGNKDVE